MSKEDQERIKFEQWLKAQPHVLNVGFNKNTQKYVLSEDQDQWIGWQARAELSLKAEARIDELETVLSKLMDKARYTLCSSQFDELDEYLESLLENK